MKKFLVLLLVGLLGIGLFGCNSQNKKENKLIVGVDDTFSPMTYKDPKTNDIIGFDVDMGEEIAKRIDVMLEWQPIEWRGMVQSLKTKKIDMVICGVTIMPERKEQVFLSDPYMNAGISIVIKKGYTGISSVKDLTNKRIGVQVGSSGANSLAKLGFIENIFTYDTYPAAFNDLGIGRIDLVVVDAIIGSYFIKQRSGEFELLPEKIITEKYGVAIAKDNISLQKKVNEAIAAMKADGSLENIAAKWFGEKNIKGIIPD